jgi:hypothetical protein
MCGLGSRSVSGLHTVTMDSDDAPDKATPPPAPRQRGAGLGGEQNLTPGLIRILARKYSDSVEPLHN